MTSYYNYANNEAEYSVLLPEAPSVKTIWEEGPETTPYLKIVPPDAAFLGEVATFKRVDLDSEDVFDVKITFLKAPPQFLENLTEDDIKKMLVEKNKDVAMENPVFHFSAGKGTLKWASYSGFTFDKNHHPAYSALHYLTGQQSITVIDVFYSVENQTFQDYYKTLVDNISYSAP